MDRKFNIAKALMYFFSALLLFLLYIVAGVVFSCIRQPKIGKECRDSFDPADCSSDAVSRDRAVVIEKNGEALTERLQMIEHAKRRIVLSTFEFRSDESGKDMMAALIAAAERGVDIKILADGMPALLNINGNAYFRALALTDNIEIKIYNRINPFLPWKLMGRLHDKYLIADDDLYILGGRNTYDYFLGEHGYKDYDRDVLVYTTDSQDKSSSIHQLEAYFSSVWAYKECSPLHARRTRKTDSALKELRERYQKIKSAYPELLDRPDYTKKTFEVNKITLLSNPIQVSAKEPVLFYELTELMKESEGEISIHTPYIICNDWMYDCLADVCKNHPQTRLLTNSAANSGNPFGAADYLNQKERLLDTGLNIYEYEGGISYHCKSLSIGDRISVVGSFNMDIRSAYLDTELMLVIDSRKLNRQLTGYMKSYEADSVIALTAGTYDNPNHVKRQEMSTKQRVRTAILRRLSWFRFLL